MKPASETDLKSELASDIADGLSEERGRSTSVKKFARINATTATRDFIAGMEEGG